MADVAEKLNELDRIWAEVLCRDLHLKESMDPFYATHKNDFFERLKKLKRKLYYLKKTKKDQLFNPTTFRSQPFKKQMTLIATYKFETLNRNMTLRYCQSCGLSKLHCDGDKVHCKTKCNDCYENGYDRQTMLDHGMLPIWRDENRKVQYHVPQELQHLTFVEGILIQRYSPLLPVQHITKGVLGLQGK